MGRWCCAARGLLLLWAAPLGAGTPSAAPSTAPSTPAGTTPSAAPSEAPSAPSAAPSAAPSTAPSIAPYTNGTPSREPVVAPTAKPSSAAPTVSPSSAAPTAAPSVPPSAAPSAAPSVPPSVPPSAQPTASPAIPPSLMPSLSPSRAPSTSPLRPPSTAPVGYPTELPTAPPTAAPRAAPTESPTLGPTPRPSPRPTVRPLQPTVAPAQPTRAPTAATFPPSPLPPGACLAADEGRPCDDGDARTVNGTCRAGLCIETPDRCWEVRCTASDSCHRPGSCSAASGLCSDPAAPDGTRCSDGDDATDGDACRNGACRGVVRCTGVECAACDSRCARAACDASTGECGEMSFPDGSTCNDDSPLTMADRCVSGKCVGLPDRCAGTVCVRVSQCHIPGVCNRTTGLCTEPTAADGTACNDGVAVTNGDACAGGVCAGVLSCGNVTCEASRGGLVDPRCHVPQCSGSGAECALPPLRPDGTECADGRPGTRAEKCAQGLCLGEPERCAGVNCPPPTTCHGAGQCSPATGECVERLLADGTPCDDADDATREDRCAAGRCSGWLECAASEGQRCMSPRSPCHRSACGASGCAVLLRECVPCSDQDPATVGDLCRAGVCIGTALNGSRVPPVAGVVAPAAQSRVSFSADAMSGSTPIEVLFELHGDSFADLGADAVLQCGQSGNSTAAVWLRGARPAVEAACSALVLAPTTLAVRFRPSAELVPSRRERVQLALRPGLMKSGVAPVGYTSIELLPRQQPVATALNKAPPVAPGQASLALKVRQCIEDQEPEEKLDRVTSPTGLLVGSGPLAAYQGAVVATLIILFALLASVGALYGFLTAAGRARLPDGCTLSRRRRLVAARLGSFVYPLTFLYPSSTLTSATLLFYGEGGFRVLAAFVLALCMVLPLCVFWVVRKVRDLAVVEPAEPKTCAERFFHGKESWEPVGAGYGHRLYHFFYDAHRFRDRYLLVADLLLNAALAVLQSVHSRSEAECKVIGYVVLCLMGGFALFVTLRRSGIAPYEKLTIPLVLWGEVVCKFLLVTVGYGNPPDHWAVATAGAIAEAIGAIIVAQAFIGLWLFFADEYTYWASLPGGGKDVTGTCNRAARFCAFWFCFYGVVDAMVGKDAGADKQTASPDEQVAGPEASQGPDYELMAATEARPGTSTEVAAACIQLGGRHIRPASRQCPLELTLEDAVAAGVAGLCAGHLAMMQVPEDSLPAPGSACGSALRSARSKACALRGAPSAEQLREARQAYDAAVGAVKVQRSVQRSTDLRAAEMLLGAVAEVLRRYEAGPAPRAPVLPSLLPPPPPRPAPVAPAPTAPPPAAAPPPPATAETPPAAVPLIPPAVRGTLPPLRRSAHVAFPRPPPL
eukprot:TRINITY_DN10843_c0_g1_i4.p1 TRINITY_DN10843_c0_g1~~TRINITY_DN10843_c0_g1_i4.p1  ORF type:complete len:1384 (+),score=267.82 TRINITY_DN10843_c0_g1_i4:68-4153(+)